MLAAKIISQELERSSVSVHSLAEDFLIEYINSKKFYSLQGKFNFEPSLVAALYADATDPQNKVLRFLLRKIADSPQVQNYTGDDYFSLQTEIVLCSSGKTPLLDQELLTLIPAFNSVCSELSRSIHDPFYRTPNLADHPLVKLYSKKGYDLVQEFENNYGLISVSNSRKLLPGIPRLLDKKYSLSVNLKGLNPEIYQLLLDWQKEYKFFDLAVQPDPFGCFDYLEHRTRLQEAVEFGKLFDLDSLQRGPSLKTKLYTIENDHLWVRIDDLESDKREITFEEILYNFPNSAGHIVTQAFHLMVRDNKIIHFDQEYFFYTLEEFTKRQTKATQKGRASPKFKTFKIDNAAFPFDIQKILLPMLLSGFKNPELVLEYFGIDPDIFSTTVP